MKILELGINPARPVREQKPKPLPDHKAPDDIVFDILGLTPIKYRHFKIDKELSNA